MPIVTNHRGPSFREYSRTPAEKKIVELENKVSTMEQQLAQLIAERAQTPEDTTDAKKSTSK